MIVLRTVGRVQLGGSGYEVSAQVPVVEDCCGGGKVDKSVRLGHRGVRGLGWDGDGAAPCCRLAACRDCLKDELMGVRRQYVGAGT